MAILYAGIDFAKNVFALHEVNEAGKDGVIRPSGPRERAAGASGRQSGRQGQALNF